MNCVTQAWDLHENELRRFLMSRVRDADLAEDLLQDVFVKALATGTEFCMLENTRAWLFRVTKNGLTDFQRTHKVYQEVSDEQMQQVEHTAPVVNLSSCLPAALNKLSAEDREIIRLCDLEGVSQGQYAGQKGITPAGAKSRVQRARKRLKKALHQACKIEMDELGNVCCFDPECK